MHSDCSIDVFFLFFYRLSLLHSSCGPAFGSSGDVGNQLLQVVLNFLTWAPSTDDTETTTTTTTSSTATAVAVPHATWLMSVRCLANAFKHPQTKQWLVANFAKVLATTINITTITFLGYYSCYR